MIAHLLALNEGFETVVYSVGKGQFFDFVCRCIEDISAGRMAMDRQRNIIELATLICAVEGWKVEGLSRE